MSLNVTSNLSRDREGAGAVRLLTCAARWSIATALLVLPGCGRNPIIQPGGGEVIFRDDFTGALEEGWLLDGDGRDVSLSARSDFASIFPPQEIEGGQTFAATRLLREADGDFVLLTRMEFDTATDLQSSGVVVEGSDGRTVLLGVSRVEQFGFRGVIMLADRGPGVDPGRAFVRSDLQTIYLRLQRTGNRFSGSFSSNGESFEVIGSLTNDLSSQVSAGIGTLIADACTSNCDAQTPAQFDFFEISRP